MAASYGSAIFVGASRRRYYKDVYLDDVAGAAVRWDAGAGASATSDTFMLPPENVVLIDVIIASATGQTKTQICRDNVPTGDILRNSLHLAAVVTRPGLSIPFGRGQKISMLQLA